MSDIIWKGFTIGSLFERSTKLALSINQKDLNIVEKKDNNHNVALISASSNGSGRVGYIENDLVDSKLISMNKITFDDQWGYTFFQQEKFVITGGHNAILEVKNDNLKSLLDMNLKTYSFISLLLNKITIKSEIFGYGYKINNKLDREIILLPCIEVSKEDEYVWNENNHYYTLSVYYINELMNKAREEKEKNTIRLYEAERAKYEAERAKYEVDYKNEKEKLIWKSFKLGDIYNFDSTNQYPYTQKQVDIVTEKDNEHDIAVIAQSEKNNGVIGYISRNANVEKYTFHNSMTFSMNFGICFYHHYDYLLLDTHGSIFRLTPKNETLSKKIEDCTSCNLFIAEIINKICAKSLYDWQWKPNSQRASRELILLPCLEVSKDDEYIWEEEGHYYTLAVNYISYLHLNGRVIFNQKLIDKYTYEF